MPSNERTSVTLCHTARPIPDCPGGRGGWFQRPGPVFGDVQHVYIVRKAAHFWRLGGAWGEVPIIRCDVEVRVRPKLFRLVVRMDGGFKTTGLGPWTYLLSPSIVDSGAFGHKTSGTSDDAYAAPTEASLLESGVPNTPTHPLNYPEELGAQLELKNYLVYFQHSAVGGPGA